MDCAQYFVCILFLVRHSATVRVETHFRYVILSLVGRLLHCHVFSVGGVPPPTVCFLSLNWKKVFAFCICCYILSLLGSYVYSPLVDVGLSKTSLHYIVLWSYCEAWALASYRYCHCFSQMETRLSSALLRVLLSSRHNSRKCIGLNWILLLVFRNFRYCAPAAYFLSPL